MAPLIPVETGGALPVGLEAAVLAPISMDSGTAFAPAAGRAERSKRPFVQARVKARWESPNSSGEVALLPGIGSNGAGSGYFRDVDPLSADLGSTIWIESPVAFR